MTTSNDDMDELLNLEEQFYREGYEEGIAEKVNHNFTEGKQYGLQVGFQRFLLLGQIVGFLDVITTPQVENTALLKNIEIVRTSLMGLKYDNGEEAVADFEAKFLKIKNKFRTILLLLNRKKDHEFKSALNLDVLTSISNTLGGELKAYVEEESEAEEKNLISDKNQDW